MHRKSKSIKKKPTTKKPTTKEILRRTTDVTRSTSSSTSSPIKEVVNLVRGSLDQTLSEGKNQEIIFKSAIVKDFIKSINEILIKLDEVELQESVTNIEGLIEKFNNNKIKLLEDALSCKVLNFILYGAACSVFLRNPRKLKKAEDCFVKSKPFEYKRSQFNNTSMVIGDDILCKDSVIILFCSLDSFITNTSIPYIESNKQHKEELLQFFRQQIIKFTGLKTKKQAFEEGRQWLEATQQPSRRVIEIPSMIEVDNDIWESFERNPNNLVIAKILQEQISKEFKRVKETNKDIIKLDLERLSKKNIPNCADLRYASTFLEIGSIINEITQECKDGLGALTTHSEIKQSSDLTTLFSDKAFWLGFNAILSYLNVDVIQLKIAMRAKFINPEIQMIREKFKEKIDFILLVTKIIDASCSKDKVNLILKSVMDVSEEDVKNDLYKQKVFSFVIKCKKLKEDYDLFLESEKKDRKAKEELAEKTFKNLLAQAKVDLEKKRQAYQEKLKVKKQGMLPPISYLDDEDEVEKVSNHHNTLVRNTNYPNGVNELEVARHEFESGTDKDIALKQYQSIIKDKAYNPIVRANAALGVVAVQIYKSKYTADHTAMRLNYLDVGLKALGDAFTELAALPPSDEINDLMFYFEEYSLKVKKAISVFQTPIKTLQQIINEAEEKLQEYHSVRKEEIKSIKGPQMLVLYLAPDYEFIEEDENARRDEALAFLKNLSKKDRLYDFNNQKYDLTKVSNERLAELGWQVPRKHRNRFDYLQEMLEKKKVIWNKLIYNVSQLEQLSKNLHTNIVTKQVQSLFKQRELKEMPVFQVDIPLEFNTSIITNDNESTFSHSSTTSSPGPSYSPVTIGDVAGASTVSKPVSQASSQQPNRQPDREQPVILDKPNDFSKEFVKGFEHARQSENTHASLFSNKKSSEAFEKGAAAATATGRGMELSAWNQEKEDERLRGDTSLNVKRPNFIRALKTLDALEANNKNDASPAIPKKSPVSIRMQQFNDCEESFNAIYNKCKKGNGNIIDQEEYKKYFYSLQDCHNQAAEIFKALSQKEKDKVFQRWQAMVASLSIVKLETFSWDDSEAVDFNKPLWPEDDIEKPKISYVVPSRSFLDVVKQNSQQRNTDDKPPESKAKDHLGPRKMSDNSNDSKQQGFGRKR